MVIYKTASFWGVCVTDIPWPQFRIFQFTLKIQNVVKYHPTVILWSNIWKVWRYQKGNQKGKQKQKHKQKTKKYNKKTKSKTNKTGVNSCAPEG